MGWPGADDPEALRVVEAPLQVAGRSHKPLEDLREVPRMGSMIRPIPSSTVLYTLSTASCQVTLSWATRPAQPQ